jgi:curved DNA-binding protein CbpA
MPEQNYYDILQVSPSAEMEVVVAAYRRLAFKYHPDRNSDPASQQKMRLLIEAYEVLSDSNRRAAYDAKHKNKPDKETSGQEPGIVEMPPPVEASPYYPPPIRESFPVINSSGEDYSPPKSRIWSGLLALLFTGTIAAALFALVFAYRPKAKVAQTAKPETPWSKPSEPKVVISDVPPALAESGESNLKSNGLRDLGKQKEREDLLADDESPTKRKAEEESEKRLEPKMTIAPAPIIPFESEPREKGNKPVQDGKANVDVREDSGQIPAGEKDKKAKEPAEKVQTLMIEELVRQMNRDTPAADRAIAAAAATGNNLKVAKVREQWVNKWNDKWAGKKLRVSGTINSVGPYLFLDRTPDDESKVVIFMFGAEPAAIFTMAKEQTTNSLIFTRWEVAFIFSDENDREKVKRLNRGRKVTIEGAVTSLKNSIRLHDCHIVGKTTPNKQQQ